MADIVIKGKHMHGMGGANRAIKRQKKEFVKRGLPNSELLFNGTININTSAFKYKVLKYDYYFKDVVHKRFPRKRVEDFGFIKIEALIHNGITYRNWGYLYFPQSSPHKTKSDFFELIGKKLEGFSHFDEIEIIVKEGMLEVLPG